MSRDNTDPSAVIRQLSVKEDGILRFGDVPVWLVPVSGSVHNIKDHIIATFGHEVMASLEYEFGRMLVGPMLVLGEGTGNQLFESIVTKALPLLGMGVPAIGELDVTAGTAEVSVGAGVQLVPGLSPHGDGRKQYCDLQRGILAGIMTHAAAHYSRFSTIYVVETSCRMAGEHDCRFVIGPAEYLREQGVVLPSPSLLPDITGQLEAVMDTIDKSDSLYGVVLKALWEYLWVLDENLVLSFVNRKWCEDMGYARDDVVGKPMTYMLHPDDVGTVIKAMERIRAGEAVELEFRTLHSRGDTRFLTMRFIPLRNADGRVEKGLGVSRSIAGAKMQSENTENLNSFRNALLDNSRVLLLVVGVDGMVINYNRAMERLTGLPANMVEGKPVDNLLVPSQAAEFKEIMSVHGRGEDLVEWDMEIVSADNIPKTCRMIPTVLAVGDKITGVMYVGRDVTAEVTRALSEIHLTEIENQLELLRRELENRYQFSNIVARAPRMRQVFETIVAVSDSTATVLIQGETGTGKALVAKAVHYNSVRKDKPFVEVDCGALTETLLESELFGHVKGAFTGAVRDRMGRFELAHNGTLFLDEISNLSVSLQVKLLRAVQEGKFERVGGTETISVDVRIVAATNENLEKLVDEGRFRKDLFYRLNVIPIHLPPLRERREDIPLLLMHFLERFTRKNSREVKGFSREAMDALMNYRWPGNVRELENLVEQAVVMTRGSFIELEDLRIPQRERKLSWPQGERGLEMPLEAVMAEPEREYILEMLKAYDGNKRKTAEALGISRSNLYAKIRKFGIGAEEYR